MKLTLTSTEGDPVEIGVENGVRVWRAVSNDPKLVARLVDGAAPLQRGWHSATVMLDARGGRVVGPQLYFPDAAGGYAEARSVKLALRGKAWSAEFFLPASTSHVRFDPSIEPCEFAVDELVVEPIAVPAGPRDLAKDRAQPGLIGSLRRLLAPTAPAAPIDPHANRKRRVLESIDRKGPGLEIGPSHDPIAPKREGYDVHVIDHASREELLGKYRDHGIQLDRIEDVDFVWSGQSYVELTGRPHHYDWIIASNVVEHVPDLIAFLADCDSILKDGGVLVLVVPDKRYCFDRFRPVSALAKVIDSHLAGNKIHTPGSSAEYFMNVVLKGGLHSWQAGAPGEYSFTYGADMATRMIAEVRDKGSYLDIHNWCFVPHSFRLIIEDLHALGYTKLREVSFVPTEGYEFFVTLGRHGTGPGLTRHQMMRAIDGELAASVND